MINRTFGISFFHLLLFILPGVSGCIRDDGAPAIDEQSRARISTAYTDDEFADARINIFKKEILKTEIAFARLVKEQGMKTGFLTYADDDAVLNRNGKLIKGKQAMAAYFDKIKLKDISLEWYPDFIDVSDSGDLGYTYGRYTFTARDVDGNPVTDSGIFHTVWKKSADGKWRFVWD